MNDAASSRNWQFAAFALHHGLADPAAIAEAMRDWVRDRSRDVADLLAERGLAPADRRRLDAWLAGRDGEGTPSERLPGSQPADAEASPSAADLTPTSLELSGSHHSDTAHFPDLAAQRLADAAPGAGQPAGRRRFRILRQHAKGGLGEVFVARDLELNRDVALKEIQTRHARNEGFRKRFLLEAEITGGLEHPGVVPVYGLGAYDDGRPFYAMRFIEGEDLREAIARFHQPPAGAAPSPRRKFASLEFRQLLRRFVDVCNAIAYAHSRGVLHRDLKPANIMLGMFGETLVVDWGLAKVLGGRPDQGALAAPSAASGDSSGAETQAGSAIGTPAFMSPEQAAGNADELGPAADIYALGATLHMLLAGQPPLRGTVVEILERVRTGLVPPPSQHDPAIPVPLDAVCRKAMALRPADRYASALDLAKDIEAWLADEPLAAWREPLADRARRWARKRPRLVAGVAAAVLVGLVAAVAGAAVVNGKNQQLATLAGDLARQADVANRARAAADEARDEAVGRLGEIKKANELLGGLFEDLQFQQPGQSPEDLGVRLGRRLRAAAEKLDADAIKDGEALASLRHSLGQALFQLGYPAEAVALAQAAAQWRGEHLGPEDEQSLGSRNNLAQALLGCGRAEEAFPIFADILSRYERTLGTDHATTLTVRNNFATALATLGRLQEALPLFAAAMQGLEKSQGPGHPETLLARKNYAAVLQSAGRLPESLLLWDATLAASVAALGPDHPDTLDCRFGYGWALYQARQAERALPLLEAALAGQQRTLGPDHPGTLESRNAVACALLELGKLAEALPAFAATLAARERILGPEHPDTLSSRGNYGIALDQSGKPEEALAQFRQAAEAVAAGGFRDRSSDILLDRLFGALEKARRWEELAAWRRKLLGHRRATGDRPGIAAELLGLADALERQGQPAAAEPLAREAVALRESLLALDPPQAEPWQLANARSVLGGLLSAQRKYAEALPILQASYDALANDAALIPAQVRSQRLAEAAERLAKHFAAVGDAAKAKEWQAKAEGHRQSPGK